MKSQGAQLTTNAINSETNLKILRSFEAIEKKKILKALRSD